jgi:hypothetical protein
LADDGDDQDRVEMPPTKRVNIVDIEMMLVPLIPRRSRRRNVAKRAIDGDLLRFVLRKSFTLQQQQQTSSISIKLKPSVLDKVADELHQKHLQILQQRKPFQHVVLQRSKLGDVKLTRKESIERDANISKWSKTW